MSKLSRDEVIAAIYTAAPEPDALAQIGLLLRNYFDADSAGLWMLQGGEIGELTQTPDLLESIEPYIQYYCKLDPWSAARKTPGQAYLGSDSVDENKLVRTEFYQDFARHFGMRRPMGIVLPIPQGTLATVAINRVSTRQLLGERDRMLLQDIAVHLRSALLLRARILAERNETGARAAALDAVSFGVVVCDAEARVRTANLAAESILRQSMVTLARGRALAIRSPTETRTLHAKIQAGANGYPAAMRLRDAKGFGLSVLVMPMVQDGQRRALVCLSPDAAPASLDADTLARLFSLSKAQAELCRLLLAGRTFEEAAAERGIATSTARSYFAIILERTGAKNLRDLLRLLGSLPQIAS